MFSGGLEVRQDNDPSTVEGVLEEPEVPKELLVFDREGMRIEPHPELRQCESRLSAKAIPRQRLIIDIDCGMCGLSWLPVFGFYPTGGGSHGFPPKKPERRR